MVDYVSDASELRRRLSAYAFNPSIDAELADKLQRMPGVEADVLSNAPELLYAYRDRLGEDGLRLMGELFVHANEHGWTSVAGGAKGTDNRAETIVDNVSRAIGEPEAGEERPAEDWPEPQTIRRDGLDWRAPAEPEPEA